jgi:hypothetical protein
VKIDEKKQDLENEKTNDIKMPFKKNRKMKKKLTSGKLLKLTMMRMMMSCTMLQLKLNQI